MALGSFCTTLGGLRWCKGLDGAHWRKAPILFPLRHPRLQGWSVLHSGNLSKMCGSGFSCSRRKQLCPPLLFCRTMSFTTEMPVLCLCYWGISVQLELNPRAQAGSLMFLDTGQYKFRIENHGLHKKVTLFLLFLLILEHSFHMSQHRLLQ